MAESYLPILILMLFAIGIAGAMILLSAVLGPRLRTRRKLDTYESGMPLLDASRKRVSIQFFLIAMVFILFDVEIAFLYPWALVFRAGARGILDHCRARLGIELGQTTPDGRFTMVEVECIAGCDRAPSMIVDDTYHEPMDRAQLDALLDGLP